ncbi:MAG: exonuclease SbcCD subunit D [Acidimicrobiia bacterium]
MRILHTSDWHVGRTIRGRSRVEEHREVLAEIAGVAGERQVDLVLVAGDLFDHAAPTAEAESVVYRALLDLAQVAPVVLVAGNHDHPRRLEAVAPLLELGRVRVGSVPRPPEGGGLLEIPDLPVRVALLPFVSQRGIVRAGQLMESDADEHGGTYADRLRLVIERLCEPMTSDTVNIVLAHLSVHGAEVVGSERRAHVFGYALPALAFPGSLSYVALGHFHRRQRVPAPAPTWYSGSPLQLDFGEAGDRKGVLVVEAEPGLPVAVEEVDVSSGTPLVVLRGTMEQVEAAVPAIGDAYVKVELDEPPRAGLADEIRGLVPGAVDVALVAYEPPIPGGERDVRAGRDPHELFVEYLRSRRVEDDRLVGLFDELLAEAHEA